MLATLLGAGILWPWCGVEMTLPEPQKRKRINWWTFFEPIGWGGVPFRKSSKW